MSCFLSSLLTNIIISCGPSSSVRSCGQEAAAEQQAESESDQFAASDEDQDVTPEAAASPPTDTSMLLERGVGAGGLGFKMVLGFLCQHIQA